nr:immunoglobulin light chain junction region [Macaca mulatta]
CSVWDSSLTTLF